jgi:hypothetical protein
MMLATLGRRSDRPSAVGLMGEGFDMLEEDLDKELFFARVRHSYWDAAEKAPTRDLMQSLIGKLDF